MSNSQKDIKKRSWGRPFVIFLGLLFILLLVDGSPWTLNFREDTFFDRLLNSTFFTEWFTPYSKAELNILSVVFTVIFLPEIVISAIQDLRSRRMNTN